jgi:hypothetical protein
MRGMEIKKNMLFTFNFVAMGQPFSFGMPGETQEATAKDLMEKLQIIVKELQRSLESPQIKAVN